jgi:hypothetical protein
MLDQDHGLWALKRLARAYSGIYAEGHCGAGSWGLWLQGNIVDLPTGSLALLPVEGSADLYKGDAGKCADHSPHFYRSAVAGLIWMTELWRVYLNTLYILCVFSAVWASSFLQKWSSLPWLSMPRLPINPS